MKGNHKKAENALTLSDMIRGIQHCVNAGVEIAEQHYIKTMDKFFCDDGTPVTKTVNINENTSISIPLICLTSHGSLDFEEIRIKTKLSIDSVCGKCCDNDLLPKSEDDDRQLTRGSFSVSLGEVHGKNNEASTAEVEMVFKRKDPPEALSRVIDYINNTVRVRENKQ